MDKAVGIVENHRLVRVRQNLTQSGNARRKASLNILRTNIMASNLHAMANSGQSDFRGIHADIKEPNPYPSVYAIRMRATADLPASVVSWLNDLMWAKLSRT